MVINICDILYLRRYNYSPGVVKCKKDGENIISTENNKQCPESPTLKGSGREARQYLLVKDYEMYIYFY